VRNQHFRSPQRLDCLPYLAWKVIRLVASVSVPGAAPQDAALAWLGIVSDLAMGLAYISVPVVLVLLLRRRRDFGLAWLIGFFAAFILLGGLVHLLRASGALADTPLAEALLKAVAAAVSVAFALALWSLMPRLLALRSPAALAREVEERGAAERRARDSEARLAALLENLADGIFVLRVTPGGEFLVETINPAFARMFDVRESAVVGGRAQLVLPGALVALCDPHWRGAAADGVVREYELEAELAGGRLVWQTLLVPMRGPGGAVDRLLGSARDVTATRRMQADLVQSARLATAGTMCAGLAHEASQPLNVAALWLRRARAEGGAQRALDVVEGQLRRAGTLVARIRALAGDEPRPAETFDAAEAVGAALRTAVAQNGADRVAYAPWEPTAPVPVRGHRARLEQAVLALLSNARDAVLDRLDRDPDAPARIAVTLRQDGARAVIEVRDSGTGIPPTLRDAIFDPFFTTKDPGRGLGLGLPFAAGVACAMGGTVDAWNLPGGGACIRLELAAVEAARAGAAPVAA
jgi:C4-dicarboxylate-specific signal transduction histidine kinase